MTINSRQSTQKLPTRPRLILDAALELIGQRGYFSFSLNEVANACGISRQGVLHHFQSKHGLLIALLVDRDQKDEEAIRAILSRDSATTSELSLPEVKNVLHALVKSNSEQPDIVRLYSTLRTEALYIDHPAYDFFQERDAKAIELFTGLVTAHVSNPELTARQLIAMMGGLEQLWLRNPNEVCLLSDWDSSIELLLPAP